MPLGPSTPSVVIEVHVQGRYRHVVMVVKGVVEPLRQFTHVVIVNIDQGGNAALVRRGGEGGLLQPGAGQVADRLGPVLIAAGGYQLVQLRHQGVVEGNRHTLHGWLPGR
jgi:hypothetical protein